MPSEFPSWAYLPLAAVAVLVILAYIRKKGWDNPANKAKGKRAVKFENDSFICIYPDGTQHSLAMSDLSQVVIETTADGPWAPDFFWILSDSQNRALRFPQETKGEQEVRDVLFKLPGFNHEAVIEASLSAEQNKFQCWSKS